MVGDYGKESEVGKGFDLFMENPYWKRIFDNAPSEELKEYYRLMFDYRSFESGPTLPAEIEKQFRELWLTRDELKYLLENAGMAQAKIQYSRCIKAIDDDPDATCVSAIACIGERRNPYYTPKDEK